MEYERDGREFCGRKAAHVGVPGTPTPAGVTEVPTEEERVICAHRVNKVSRQERGSGSRDFPRGSRKSGAGNRGHLG